MTVTSKCYKISKFTTTFVLFRNHFGVFYHKVLKIIRTPFAELTGPISCNFIKNYFRGNNLNFRARPLLLHVVFSEIQGISRVIFRDCERVNKHQENMSV